MDFTCPECGQPADSGSGWCTNGSCPSSNTPAGQRPAPDEPVQVPPDGGSTPARTS